MGEEGRRIRAAFLKNLVTSVSMKIVMMCNGLFIVEEKRLEEF